MLYKLALLSATQPLSRPVPGQNASSYLGSVGHHKVARRVAVRQCTLWWSGQKKFKLDGLPPGVRRLLWIYFGENQIGDALMDLAARSLLVELGFQVDLFAAASVAALFERDPWLGRVGHQASHFAGVNYDCAIVLSNKHRPLQPKIHSFSNLPWVSLHEYFTGPNFHRGLFTAQRLADLAGISLGLADLERHGRQKLGPVEKIDGNGDKRSPPAVALVVGGVHANRSYEHWDAVMRGLLASGQHRFALVGSGNGTAQAQALARLLSGQAEIDDFTGRLTLAQTRLVLDAASVAVCPDGGLMHLALTTRAALVPLFSAQIAPLWRLPASNAQAALRSPTSRVSDIPAHDIINMIMRSSSLKQQ